jgi:hypothetical protein
MCLLRERGGSVFLLATLLDEGLVDVRDNTSTSDGSLDQSVKLLITTDSELQVARGDTLHLQILRGVTSQLENLYKQQRRQVRNGHDGGARISR